MLDKLELTTMQEIDTKIVRELFPTYQLSYKPSNQYRKCIVISRNGRQLITVSTHPIWNNISPTKIQTNPGSWQSSIEMNLHLSNLVDTSHLKITRLDHAVDIPMSLKLVHSCVRIKGKQSNQKYFDKSSESYKRDTLTGFYLGALPEIYCIYDKGYELNKMKLKRNQESPLGDLTRIELRQTNKKIKYNNFLDLSSYVDDNPFSNLEFYMISQESIKHSELEELVTKSGFTHAYFKLNKNNNFKRDHLKQFNPINMQKTLNEIYQVNLRHFFNADETTKIIEKIHKQENHLEYNLQ